MFIRNEVLLLVATIFKASLAVLPPPTGGVVSNAPECASIGRATLSRGGTAMDAALATLFCEGLTMPQGMGIGGGFIMTIYDKQRGEAVALNSRETAPASATENMYGGSLLLASKGGAAVAVPGELKGYWAAYQRYGRLPWASLIEPTIELCFRGHLVTPFLQNIFESEEAQLRSDPGLREAFINPATNSTYRAGDYIRRPVLGRTLQIIAKDGIDAFYDGVLTESIINELKNLNGSITADDLKNYEPLWQEPLRGDLENGQTFYAPPLPSSGPMLVSVFNVLNNFLNTDDVNLVSITNWQRIVEAIKYAYGARTRLGDPAFYPGVDLVQDELVSTAYADAVRGNISDTRTSNDPRHYGAELFTSTDKGTSNIVVIAPNGDSVAVTSTINQNFGAGILLPTSGIILNCQMYDFASPVVTNIYGMPSSPANFIRPGKRPLSTMTPSIVVDENGDVVLAFGGAGITKLTSMVMVGVRYLWFNQPLLSSVTSKRLHHQLFPMELDSEVGFNQTILDGLSALGHRINVSNFDSLCAVTAIRQEKGVVDGAYDIRRGGSVSLYYSYF